MQSYRAFASNISKICIFFSATIAPVGRYRALYTTENWPFPMRFSMSKFSSRPSMPFPTFAVNIPFPSSDMAYGLLFPITNTDCPPPNPHIRYNYYPSIHCKYDTRLLVLEKWFKEILSLNKQIPET
ncbi:unnamed protein product [Oppiella nova]|uniref:Uncharacterized protein n=1 Tax=Oppiella nova TaxID=334625 RepID=A0A7R9M6W4_9ACAR|nr:unnamed protein product [Oppiella nova]CAG2171905.1 unnamed protein product [Oppiella nova]